MAVSYASSASFMAKCQLVFALTQKTLLLRGFILKPTEKF